MGGRTSGTRHGNGTGWGGPAKGTGTGGPKRGRDRKPYPACKMPNWTTETARIASALANTDDARARRAARLEAQAALESHAFELAMSRDAQSPTTIADHQRVHAMVGGGQPDADEADTAVVIRGGLPDA